MCSGWNKKVYMMKSCDKCQGIERSGGGESVKTRHNQYHVSIRTSNTIITRIIQLLTINYINKNLKNSIKGMCTSGWDQNWRRNDEMKAIMLSIFLINNSQPWVWEVKCGSWAGSRVFPGSALGFQSFQASYVHTYYVLHKNS